jgi:hypothetical protein
MLDANAMASPSHFSHDILAWSMPHYASFVKRLAHPHCSDIEVSLSLW